MQFTFSSHISPDLTLQTLLALSNEALELWDVFSYSQHQNTFVSHSIKFYWKHSSQAYFITIKQSRGRPVSLRSTIHLSLVHCFNQLLSPHTIPGTRPSETFLSPLSLIFQLTLVLPLTSPFLHHSVLFTSHHELNIEIYCLLWERVSIKTMPLSRYMTWIL